jgi:sec-independent protein translocase protein TatA
LNKTNGEKKMPQLGPTELIIILVIVIVLFGVGRISKIAGEMGTGIKAFKQGLQGDEDKKIEKEEVEAEKPKDA